MKNTGIYVHIPFCASRCNYCNFLSIGDADAEVKEKYTKALIEEIRAKAEGKADTVYLGGGTPTALSLLQILRVIDALRPYTDKNTEFTIEANPKTVDKHYLYKLEDAGVNRISFGMQSTNDGVLKKLGRTHTYADFWDTYNAAQDAGFNNINVDLISAVPFAEKEKDDIHRLINISPSHISAYSLSIENGTNFEGLTAVSDEVDRAKYAYIKEELQNAGYEWYEISNFAKNGKYSRHNTAYWTRKSYIGVGLGAHSFDKEKSVRYSNVTELETYLSEENKIAETTEITRTDAMAEFFFLGLRLIRGVSLHDFYDEFGVSAESIYGGVFDNLLKHRLIHKEGGVIRLTDYGVDVSNTVFTEFIQSN
ncbi:coproporphyrinogen III oxidase [Clostridia bacterium]|nr:coproporphyrinogen III oxidase [Clostridia bacterium]